MSIGNGKFGIDGKSCNLNSVQNWRLNSAHKYHDEELGRQNCERENWRWLVSSLPSVCRASGFKPTKIVE